jgi:hypothetical protein
MSDSMREWGEMTDEAIQARKERSKHLDLGLPRLPDVSKYQKEVWPVPKDVIYNAIQAINIALSYIPHIKTDIPQWQKTLEQDIIRIQCSLSELRKLDGSSSK